ncbi:MAG: hypothetical protein M3548_00580 [Actinomycetota bacterium]|nr:hypothetical protein [Actinomycetota bacterium]
MSEVPAHMFWWLHDARWYQGVARRFGQDAANEINAEAAKFVARRFSDWHARVHGKPAPTAAEVSAALESVSTSMFAPGAMKFHNDIHSASSFETVITRNFALQMLRAAGSLEGYQCPCLELRDGWFEGMGVTVEDKCVECLRTGGSACRFVATLENPADTEDAPSPTQATEAPPLHT